MPRNNERLDSHTPPQGKLGVLIPGMGAVATTFIAGVEAVRNKTAPPIGSVTQLGRFSANGSGDPKRFASNQLPQPWTLNETLALFDASKL